MGISTMSALHTWCNISFTRWENKGFCIKAVNMFKFTNLYFPYNTAQSLNFGNTVCGDMIESVLLKS